MATIFDATDDSNILEKMLYGDGESAGGKDDDFSAPVLPPGAIAGQSSATPSGLSRKPSVLHQQAPGSLNGGARGVRVGGTSLGEGPSSIASSLPRGSRGGSLEDADSTGAANSDDDDDDADGAPAVGMNSDRRTPRRGDAGRRPSGGGDATKHRSALDLEVDGVDGYPQEEESTVHWVQAHVQQVVTRSGLRCQILYWKLVSNSNPIPNADEATSAELRRRLLTSGASHSDASPMPLENGGGASSPMGRAVASPPFRLQAQGGTTGASAALPAWHKPVPEGASQAGCPAVLSHPFGEAPDTSALDDAAVSAVAAAISARSHDSALSKSPTATSPTSGLVSAMTKSRVVSLPPEQRMNEEAAQDSQAAAISSQIGAAGGEEKASDRGSDDSGGSSTVMKTRRLVGRLRRNLEGDHHALLPSLRWLQFVGLIVLCVSTLLTITVVVVSSLKFVDFNNSLAAASRAAEMMEAGLRMGQSVRELLLVDLGWLSQSSIATSNLQADFVSQTDRFEALLTQLYSFAQTSPALSDLCKLL